MIVQGEHYGGCVGTNEAGANHPIVIVSCHCTWTKSGRVRKNRVAAWLLRASCFLQPSPTLTVRKTEILGQIDDQRQVFFFNAVEFRGIFSGNRRPNQGPNGALP
jgi:hypothetical protein